MTRVKIAEFGIINKNLANAVVTFYLTDDEGSNTGVKADIFQASTGPAARENPQTLDADGKLRLDCYVEGGVMATITGINSLTERSLKKVRENPLEFQLPITSSKFGAQAATDLLSDPGFIAVSTDLLGQNNIGAVGSNIVDVNTIADDLLGPDTIGIVAANIADVQNADENANIAKAVGGFSYIYSTNTESSDPGSGFFKFNNATLSSATELYISETTSNAMNIASEIITWDDSTSVIHGKIRLFKQSDPSSFRIYDVTGTITDNGAWDTLTISHVSGNGSWSNNDAITIQYLRTGDKGDLGPAGTLPFAIAGGTANAITADFTPDVSLTSGTVVAVQSIAANTTTTPTFSPDGLTARNITARGGGTLGVGDTGTAGYVMLLAYNAANTRWELMNPSKVASTDLLDGAVTLPKMANIASNSILGNATASSAAVLATQLVANTFPARSSTGNWGAKPITDFGLSLVDDADAATARTTLGIPIAGSTVIASGSLPAGVGLLDFNNIPQDYAAISISVINASCSVGGQKLTIATDDATTFVSGAHNLEGFAASGAGGVPTVGNITVLTGGGANLAQTPSGVATDQHSAMVFLTGYQNQFSVIGYGRVSGGTNSAVWGFGVTHNVTDGAKSARISYTGGTFDAGTYEVRGYR